MGASSSRLKPPALAASSCGLPSLIPELWVSIFLRVPWSRRARAREPPERWWYPRVILRLVCREWAGLLSGRAAWADLPRQYLVKTFRGMCESWRSLEELRWFAAVFSDAVAEVVLDGSLEWEYLAATNSLPALQWLVALGVPFTRRDAKRALPGLRREGDTLLKARWIMDTFGLRRYWIVGPDKRPAPPWVRLAPSPPRWERAEFRDAEEALWAVRDHIAANLYDIFWKADGLYARSGENYCDLLAGAELLADGAVRLTPSSAHAEIVDWERASELVGGPEFDGLREVDEAALIESAAEIACCQLRYLADYEAVWDDGSTCHLGRLEYYDTAKQPRFAKLELRVKIPPLPVAFYASSASSNEASEGDYCLGDRKDMGFSSDSGEPGEPQREYSPGPSDSGWA